MAKKRRKNKARLKAVPINLSHNETRALLIYLERGLGAGGDDTMDNPLYRAGIRVVKKLGKALRA